MGLLIHMICSCASCCNSSQVKTTETWYPLYYWSFATMLIVNANCWDSSEKIISLVYFCNYFLFNNKGWDHCKKWFWLVLHMNYVKFYIWGCVSAMYTLCAWLFALRLTYSLQSVCFGCLWAVLCCTAHGCVVYYTVLKLHDSHILIL